MKRRLRWVITTAAAAVIVALPFSLKVGLTKRSATPHAEPTAPKPRKVRKFIPLIENPFRPYGRDSSVEKEKPASLPPRIERELDRLAGGRDALGLENLYRNSTSPEVKKEAFIRLADLLAASGAVDQTNLSNYIPIANLDIDTLLDIALLDTRSPEAGWNAISTLRILYGDLSGEQFELLQDGFTNIVAGSPFKEVRWWAMNAIALHCGRYLWIQANSAYPDTYESGEHARQVEAGNCP
ncbi:MAG TPA: hypothetical protein VJH24_05205 [Candidatus Bilamarchaeaceae archaeon]|nr:hypothetical protein [Candidatus Bilamarchaeaceae archaeon]